jgi:hypothetical protein
MSQAVQKIETWLPMSSEALEDAEALSLLIHAFMEYEQSPVNDAPLTAQERLTGTRLFTASSGYVLHVRVGWREAMYRALEAIRRERYPDEYAELDYD